MVVTSTEISLIKLLRAAATVLLNMVVVVLGLVLSMLLRSIVVRKRLIQSHLTRHGCFLTNHSTVFAGPGQVSLNQPFGVMY